MDGLLAGEVALVVQVVGIWRFIYLVSW